MNNTGSNINKYLDLMEEIKKRYKVIRGFLKGQCHTLYKATTLECVYLQIRKILELIALGSLVVNKEEFAKYHKDFDKYWHGGRILQDIQKINPRFYPVPIKEEMSNEPGFTAQWKIITDGYLTKEDFIELYNSCGKILHADNPFGEKIDYSYYEKEIHLWTSKIIRLLNSHQIHLLGDENIYLIHMKESMHDKVHGYTFEPVKTASQTEETQENKVNE
jgi:hypothetical protein